jgi:hypothetical protein
LSLCVELRTSEPSVFLTAGENTDQTPGLMSSSRREFRSSATAQIIHLHPDAPAKPGTGQACNGCGVCCAAEPCPLGVLVSGRRHGACKALLWSEAEGRYRCGMVSAPGQVLPWLPRVLHGPVRRGTLRWISAASGCDATLEVGDTLLG